MPRRAPKAVRLPSPPLSLADMGAKGPANVAGCTVEDATEIDPKTGEPGKNPNGSKRRRRVSRIEDMLRRNQIDKRQWQAAHQLQTAWENTQKTPPKIRPVQADTCPGPDVSISLRVDRMRKLVRISRHVPRDTEHVVWWVVCDNRSIVSLPGAKNNHRRGRYAERLRKGLDALADGLGI